jgi:hypothetical protein
VSKRVLGRIGVRTEERRRRGKSSRERGKGKKKMFLTRGKILMSRARGWRSPAFDLVLSLWEKMRRITNHGPLQS